ncbi:MAG: hypothetical protein HC927_05840, partial [Deltaproteobacteria bacterium]|nr:hypothetical protein [Deltaproteobacteria bacterium]
EEACRTLGRIASVESAELLRRVVLPASDGGHDEDETSYDLAARAGAEAARALALCDPVALLDLDNDAAANALEHYAVQTGSLVFGDHIVDARGRRLRRRGGGGG